MLHKFIVAWRVAQTTGLVLLVGALTLALLYLLLIARVPAMP